MSSNKGSAAGAQSGRQRSSAAMSSAASLDRQSTLQSLTSAQLTTELFGSDRPAASRHTSNSSKAGSKATTTTAPSHASTSKGLRPPSSAPPNPADHPDGFSQRTHYVTEEEFLKKRDEDRAAKQQGPAAKNPADAGYISSLVTGVRVDNIKSSLIRKSQRDKSSDQDEEDYRTGSRSMASRRSRDEAAAASHASRRSQGRVGGHNDDDDDDDDDDGGARQYPRASAPAAGSVASSKSSGANSGRGYASVASGQLLHHQGQPAMQLDDRSAASKRSTLEAAMHDVSSQLLDSQNSGDDFYDNVLRGQGHHGATGQDGDGLVLQDDVSGRTAGSNLSRAAVNTLYASSAGVAQSTSSQQQQQQQQQEQVAYEAGYDIGDDVSDAEAMHRAGHGNLAQSSTGPHHYHQGQRDQLPLPHHQHQQQQQQQQQQQLGAGNGMPGQLAVARQHSVYGPSGLSRANSYQNASYRQPSSQPSYRGPGEMTLKRRHFGGKDRGYVRNVHKACTDGQMMIPDPATLRSPVTTVYSRHEDFYADGNKSYYVPDSRKKRRMCCVVPCYNEPSDALRRTLRTLHFQLDNLRKLDFDFHVAIIMDGWQLTSESMRTYLQTIFDMPENVENEGPTWWDDLNTLEGNPSVETFIIQNVNIETWNVEPVFIEPEELPGARMHITLLVKRDNRRKHNTLEWFFRSFAVEYGAEYAFTTDCGTLFEPDTIYHLARHLDLFPRCGGATGRQRVMSAQQQGLDHESWYAAWMRSVQGFEYEATYASYVGAFSMTGMLPVIPGPCGLFNMKHLAGQGVEFFFDKVKQDPDTAGLLLGNGLLAEDRFLSYAAVVSTGKPTITEFVPESVFFFEAETELRTFVFQRRRWNNGTFACFVWLMLNLDIIRKSPHGIVFKFLTQFLIVWQVLWLAVSLIAPSLFLVLLRLGIRHTFPANEEEGTSFWADMICVSYIVLYVAFIVQHVQSKFEAWLFHVFTLIHGIAVLFIISTFIHAAATRRDEVVDLTLYLFGVYQGAPIVLSLIVSPRSCGFLVKYFLPYMIFLPTHTMTFWTYALTRTFDLTWGNRPTTHKVPKNERNLIVDKLKSSAISLISIVACVNLIIAIVLLQIAVSGRTLWIIWTLVSLMIFSGVQMALSFGFALEYHLIRRLRRWFRLGRLARARHRRKNQRKKSKDLNQSQAQLLEWDNTGVPK